MRAGQTPLIGPQTPRRSSKGDRLLFPESHSLQQTAEQGAFRRRALPGHIRAFATAAYALILVRRRPPVFPGQASLKREK